MCGRHNNIYCRYDNAAVVAMVNKGTSENGVTAHILRCLSFVTARWQISISASHLPGADNDAADALSRNDFLVFGPAFGMQW